MYILYLAWKIASAPVVASELKIKKAPSFLNGFVLAIANPKAFAAIGAVYSGHTLVEHNILSDSIVKIVSLSMVIVVVNTAWLVFGSSFSRILSKPQFGRLANLLFAIMLVTSVAIALFAL